MKCPYCHQEELKVIDSRDALDVNAIRRRRECLQCQKRFTTFETVELNIQVHKRDGRYEEFQQKKLINGLQAACRHTSLSRDHVIALASKIEDEVRQRGAGAVSTVELGDIVMGHLLQIDPIAYIRFACVYRRFKNVSELKEAMEAIQPKDDKSRDQHLKRLCAGEMLCR